MPDVIARNSMRSNRLYIIGMITVALALVACNGKTIYSHYEPTPIEGWERSDTLVYSNIVIKATADYKEEIGLRINDAFPFRSLFLVVEQHVRHNGQWSVVNGQQPIVKTDTLSCRLIDKNGNVKGRGLSYYQYNFHLTTLRLNAGDTLDIRIRHHMKREILPGIANVGMTLSK